MSVLSFLRLYLWFCLFENFSWKTSLCLNSSVCRSVVVHERMYALTRIYARRRPRQVNYTADGNGLVLSDSKSVGRKGRLENRGVPQNAAAVRDAAVRYRAFAASRRRPTVLLIIKEQNRWKAAKFYKPQPKITVYRLNSCVVTCR